MHYATKRTCFGEYVFDLNDEVYDPAEDTFLFAENLEVKEGELVLDLGTGCGILGILSAKKANIVVAIDLNPYAIAAQRRIQYSTVFKIRCFLFKQACLQLLKHAPPLT